MRKRFSDRIKYIKKVLGTPYHFFTTTEGTSKISPKGVLVVFEDKDGKRFTFSERSINEVINESEKYVASEIEAGALKEPKKESKKIEDTTKTTKINVTDENKTK